MLEFKEIELSDKPLFDHYLAINGYENSEYSFTTWFAWQDAYNLKFAVVDDCLCVIGQNNHSRYAYFPVGEKENVQQALYEVMCYFKEEGLSFNLMSVSNEMIDLLGELGMQEMMQQEERRDFADYIYLREKLVSLGGKKLQGKRNHYNFFARNYQSRLEPITKANEEACGQLLHQLIDDRSRDPKAELAATLRILNNREALGLESAALYAEDKLVGVILGEAHSGSAIIHIAKADIEYRGAAVALFKLFLEAHFQEEQYINFMEDMGIEGLRKSKLAFVPERLLEKSMMTLKPSAVFSCGSCTRCG